MTRPVGLRRAAGLALAALVLLPAAGLAEDPTVVRVGISLPLGGASLASSGPIRDAVAIALAQADVPGVRFETVVLDHAVNGVHDPATGARDIEALVADPAVLAVIGPFNSSVAERQIPVSNAAGLLQCSPANTAPGLTKGDAGRALRAAAPDRISYVRVQATDDVQGPAMAIYAYQVLGHRSVAIVDDTETYGAGIADAFAAAWSELGGTIAGRAGAPAGTTDYAAVLAAAAAADADAVYFGGVSATGAPELRTAMAATGLGATPFLVAEGIVDGSADVPDSYLARTGPAAVDTWSSQSALHDYPGRAALAELLAAEGRALAAYSGSGFACAEIVIAAVADAVAAGSLDRATVRAIATEPGRSVETVLGPVGFDAVGDTTLRVVAFYRTDLSIDADPAWAGQGDWVFIEQIAVGA